MSNKKLIKISPKITEDLLEKITLKIVQTGVDKTNFKILNILPSNIDTMMKEFNLTKVPVNNRINELEKVGLVRRWRGTGLVILTDLGKIFIETINRGEEIVRDKLVELLKNLSSNNKY